MYSSSIQPLAQNLAKLKNNMQPVTILKIASGAACVVFFKYRLIKLD